MRQSANRSSNRVGRHARWVPPGTLFAEMRQFETPVSRPGRHRLPRHAGHRRGTTRSRMPYRLGCLGTARVRVSVRPASAPIALPHAAAGAQGHAPPLLSTPTSRSTPGQSIVGTRDFSPPHHLPLAQTSLLACSCDGSVSLDPPVVRLDILILPSPTA